MSRRLIATPLAAWEREGVKAALIKTALPADDVDDPRVLLWRFETLEGIPVGFGGLEVFGSDALLRSLVTLPPLRQVGMGAAMVAMLEIEARALKCHAVYLLTGSARLSSPGSAMPPARTATCRQRCAAADNSPRSARRRRGRCSSASARSIAPQLVIGSGFHSSAVLPPCPLCAM